MSAAAVEGEGVSCGVCTRPSWTIRSFSVSDAPAETKRLMFVASILLVLFYQNLPEVVPIRSAGLFLQSLIGR